MEENTKTFFGNKKPGQYARKPYRVDAAALESKGFGLIRYDRHESYAKAYTLEGRVFIGTVNPVTGDRTVNKAGAFASAKDIDLLREAWNRLSEDVLGPRPERKEAGESAVILHAPETRKDEGSAMPPLDKGHYSYQDLTLGDDTALTPKIMTANEVKATLGNADSWKTVTGSSKSDTSVWSVAADAAAKEGK